MVLEWSVDESLARQGDHLGRDSGQVVYRHDAFDLRKQTLDETKVATRDASDRIDHGSVGVLVERGVQAELHPLVLDHPLQLLPAQGSELMHEAHPRVQLCVAGQPFLQTWHANEDDSNVSTVVKVAQLLEARRLESVGFVDDEQIGRLPNHGSVWIAVPRRSCSKAVDCPPQVADGMLDGARRVGHARRV